MTIAIRLFRAPLTINHPQYTPKRFPVARDLYELPNGWIGRVDKYLSLLPVQIAASVLESFYNVVIDNVRQKWIQQQQPVNSFTITWANIELEFSSATRTIPWNFVLAFAERLAHLTQRGFVGKYCIYYIHLPTGEEISIHLLIPLVAAGA
ncbi:hypothetical protein HO173_002675 [Letharia columbiana]|uniref:Uncharacterized protein n=1 Tax=Letharia columbiana TaxID=112416 RepID=A0A8H6G2Z8_9LECA|nr:uncharacterized protein HO173_002675 [Letharia columbiana]KAF6239413.1 hypothetical protein HO173_002675 [Letharia columbiana]